MSNLAAPATPAPAEGFRRGRTIGVVTVLTVLVSLVGYVREAALAAKFGVSPMMDAYFAAIFIPTVCYFVLIAGTLSPLFIPILFEHNVTDDARGASEAYSAVTNFVVCVVLGAIVIGMSTARLWLPLLFSGFADQTRELALRLTYIVFPAVFFLALAGILTGVLNGFHRFTLPAIAPGVPALFVIATVLIARGPNAILWVGVAALVGYFAQYAVLAPSVHSLGVRWRPVFAFKHPAVRQLLRLGIPVFLYLSVANIPLFIERNLASQISSGGVSTVSYALRLFTVPANFLAAPMATVFYPQLAHDAVREKFDSVSAQVSRMFRFVVFLFLPITVWVMLNALPITQVLYQRGQFSAADSVRTGQVLTLYGIGILPTAIAVILMRCFFAVQDTVTPLIVEIIGLVYYAIAAPLLSRRYGLNGLAAARGGAFILVGLMLMAVLMKRDLLRLQQGRPGFYLRVTAATALMGVTSWVVLTLLGPRSGPDTTLVRLVTLGASGTASAVVLIGASRLLGIEESKRLLSAGLDMVAVPFRRNGSSPGSQHG